LILWSPLQAPHDNQPLQEKDKHLLLAGYLGALHLLPFESKVLQILEVFKMQILKLIRIFHSLKNGPYIYNSVHNITLLV